MAKSCVTEKTARRQEWIENGLLELMQSREFEQITVSDLCRHLQLSRRSFYRYFRDLEDVLDSLLDNTFRRFHIHDEMLNVEQLEKNYTFWIENKKLLDALYKSGMMEKLFEYTARYASNTSLDAYLTDDDRASGLVEEVRLFTIHGAVSLTLAWYLNGFRRTPAEMARIASRMLFQPILKK